MKSPLEKFSYRYWSLREWRESCLDCVRNFELLPSSHTACGTVTE